MIAWKKCLTASTGKTYDKKIGAQIWDKRAKIGPEIILFVIFSSFGSLVFL